MYSRESIPEVSGNFTVAHLCLTVAEMYREILLLNRFTREIFPGMWCAIAAIAMRYCTLHLRPKCSVAASASNLNTPGFQVMIPGTLGRMELVESQEDSGMRIESQTMTGAIKEIYLRFFS